MLDAGDQAPGFELYDLSGVSHPREEFLKGGEALLAFYKASCPVCQLTLPFLDRLARQSQTPVVFISQDDAKTATRFAREYGIASAITLLDGKGYPASNAFGLTHVPSIFLIQSDGAISRAWMGFSKPDMESLAIDVGQSLFTPQENNRLPQFKPG